MDGSRKIALFGGTFDPVHAGHLYLAERAQEALQLDEVHFLPCQISPHKLDGHAASALDRLEMLRLATQHLSWASVDDFELHQEGPSFSYQTAEIMSQRFQNDRLFWIMGGDQWAALPRWKNPERLAERVEFIVVARGEMPPPRLGYHLHVVNGEHPASSTELRNLVYEKSFSTPWLAPAVKDYIQRHQLYIGGR